MISRWRQIIRFIKRYLSVWKIEMVRQWNTNATLYNVGILLQLMNLLESIRYTHCCLHTPWECNLDLVIFLHGRNQLNVPTNQTACIRMVRPWTWCGKCFGDSTYLSGSHMIDKILCSLFWFSCKKKLTRYRTCIALTKMAIVLYSQPSFSSQLQGLAIL